MKDKKDRAVPTKALAALVSQGLAKKLSKKGPQMKSLMRAMFETPSSEEGNKSPSLERIIEKIIEALEPKKVGEEAIIVQPCKALESKKVETKAPKPHEAEAISLCEEEDIGFDFKHIAGGQLDNEKLTEVKDYGFIGHIDGGQLLLDSCFKP